MNSPSPRDIALRTWTACQALLPSSIVQNLTTPSTDPAPLRKKETNIMRLRVLPARKMPAGFWSSTWCFYEIAVGVYGGGLTVGGVAFIQFPNQKVCGDGQFTRSTIEILQRAQALRPADFTLTAVNPPDQAATILAQRYFAKQHPHFPIDVAAKDLGWLIEQTLPRIECL